MTRQRRRSPWPNVAGGDRPGPTLTLSGFTTANLTDTAGGNTFTVSGWTGSGIADGQCVIPDTVAASKNAGYTLTNTSLSSTDGMALALSGITTANLAATTAGKTFTVSGWTGSGSLTDTATGIVTASKSCRLHPDQHVAHVHRRHDARP